MLNEIELNMWEFIALTPVHDFLCFKKIFENLYIIVLRYAAVPCLLRSPHLPYRHHHSLYFPPSSRSHQPPGPPRTVVVKPYVSYTISTHSSNVRLRGESETFAYTFKKNIKIQMWNKQVSHIFYIFFSHSTHRIASMDEWKVDLE